MQPKRTDSGRGCGGNAVVGAVTLGTAHHTPPPLARGTAACGTTLIRHAAHRTPRLQIRNRQMTRPWSYLGRVRTLPESTNKPWGKRLAV